MDDEQQTIELLLATCRRDQHAWINGDASAYALPAGGTMMCAWGGFSAAGPTLTQYQHFGSALFESGSGEVEFLDGGVSGDVAWLVVAEHAEVEFAGRRRPARWELRVTELFRHTDTGWERFHRHADPLVWGHPMDEVLDLLV